MDAKAFLKTVLPDSGYYCVVGICSQKKRNTVQKFYSSIDLVVAAAKILDTDKFNVFFAVSTFSSDQSRETSNVSLIRSLFLDIDCGEGKPYPNQMDALVALHRFHKAAELPKPTCLINSGRGIHVYWALAQPVTRDEWLPAAEKLKILCRQHKFHADPVITSDAARILRLPTTRNFKTIPPTNVVIIGDRVGNRVPLPCFTEVLKDVPIPVSLPEVDYTPADEASMKALMGNTTKSFMKILQRTAVGKGCAQIHNAVTNAKTLSYPEWLNVLSIAKHCDEGYTAAHAISKPYVGYSASETEKVLASIKYPHLCVTFEHNNPEACIKCPLRGKIKSPISIGMGFKEATPEQNIVKAPTSPSTSTLAWRSDDDAEHDSGNLTTAPMGTFIVPEYPKPYFRGQQGGVYLRKKSDDGDAVEEEEIYKRDLYLVKRIHDPINGPCFVFRHHTIREGVQEFIIPTHELSSPEEFRKSMGTNDIFLLQRDTGPLMTYVRAWVRKLQATQDVIAAKTQFGWTRDCKSFVIGNKEIFADRAIDNPASFATAQYFNYFERRGTLEKWKSIAEFYNKPGYEIHQFMFALSFGAPLMHFIPQIHGGIFHICSSESGYGKTTGQVGGASVWGNPGKLVIKGDDTTNSMWNFAEVLKNFPLYVDELSNIPAKPLSDFAYKVDDGKQRKRLSNKGQNQERFQGEEWDLMVGTSANTSLLEKITSFRALPKGESQRVFECNLPHLPFTTQDGDALNRILANNFGHAGPIYIQNVLRNVDLVSKLVQSTKEHITAKAGLTTQNRIWAASAAVTLTGAKLAKHWGLWDVNVDNLMRWTIRQLKARREGMREMELDIDDVINQYYADNRGAIMRLRSTKDARTGDIEELVHPDSMPFHHWVGRHEYDVNKLFLMITPFKRWCIEQQYHYGTMVELIKRDLQGEIIKKQMGKGTTIKLKSQTVLAISWGDDNEIPTKLFPEIEE